MKPKYFIIALPLILLVSGCVGLEGFDLALFQSQKPETVEATPDLIVVQNLNVIPSPVSASVSEDSSSEFTVSLEVKHQGDPKESKPVIVDVCLYDWGVCKPISSVIGNMVPAWEEQITTETNYIISTGEYLAKKTDLEQEDIVLIRDFLDSIGDKGSEKYDETNYGIKINEETVVTLTSQMKKILEEKLKVSLRVAGSTCGSELKTFYPQQVEFVEWVLTAPTNDAIAGMKATCPIRFKVDYTFTAISQVDINVIDTDKLKQLQRSGESYYITPKQSVGIGPIKIYFEFSQPQPFKENSKVIMLVTVEDKGSGLLVGGKITKIDVTANDESLEINCAPTENVQVIRKRSQQIRCEVSTPGITEEKTYYVTAKLDYSYSLDNEKKVSIIPITQ